MTNLTGKLKTAGIFVFGFLTGAILLGSLIVWRDSIMFRDMSYQQIFDHANVAFMIRAGREETLVKTIEDSLRHSIVTADSVWGDADARVSSFRYVQQYYEKFNLDVPAEIRPILQKLPPRPSTSNEMKTTGEENTEHNEPAPQNSSGP